MAKKTVKNNISWESIGKNIGKKIESELKQKPCGFTEKAWTINYREHGGGFGRLLFAIGVLWALHYSNIINLPWWLNTLIVIGFALMTL